MKNHLGLAVKSKSGQITAVKNCGSHDLYFELNLLFMRQFSVKCLEPTFVWVRLFWKIIWTYVSFKAISSLPNFMKSFGSTNDFPRIRFFTLKKNSYIKQYVWHRNSLHRFYSTVLHSKTFHIALRLAWCCWNNRAYLSTNVTRKRFLAAGQNSFSMHPRSKS